MSHKSPLDACAFNDDNPLGSVFAPLIGSPAWLVRKGYGSFLTLEFGSPHLRVREPMVSPADATQASRRALEHRRVTVRGAWHLWIYCCNWRVLSRSGEIGASLASDETINEAAQEMDSQQLLSIEADPTKGTSVFHFEHGVHLETDPMGGDGIETLEQWMLYTPSQWVFTYRADGRYSWAPGDQSVEDHAWRPLH